MRNVIAVCSDSHHDGSYINGYRRTVCCQTNDGFVCGISKNFWTRRNRQYDRWDFLHCNNFILRVRVWLCKAVTCCTRRFFWSCCVINRPLALCDPGAFCWVALGHYNIAVRHRCSLCPFNEADIAYKHIADKRCANEKLP